MSAAAGLALIETLEAEKLVENAAKMGRYFTEAAWALDDPWIGDVRFTGLLGGIELVKNRDTKEVLGKAEMAKVKDGLHARGMLITVSGLHGNVLRLQPPLSVTSASDRSVHRGAAQDVRRGPIRGRPDSCSVRVVAPPSMNLFAFRKHIDRVLHPIVCGAGASCRSTPTRGRCSAPLIGLVGGVVFFYGWWWPGLRLLLAARPGRSHRRLQGAQLQPAHARSAR